MATNTIDFDQVKKESQLKDAGEGRNFSTEFPSVKDQVSPEEWQARVDLAACYRLVDLYDMTYMIYNHITVRVPGTDEFLVNLYGLTYKEITASSLAKVDLRRQHRLEAAGHRLRHQRRRLRDPQRNPQGSQRHQFGDPHPQHGRYGCRRDVVRLVAIDAERDAVRRTHRLSRL